MRCLACKTEKQPGSWLCPNCGTPIPEPPKPPYKARGWEWAAALGCMVLALSHLDEEPATVVTVLGFIAFFAWPALAFSAARDRTRRVGRAVGILCLIFWILLTLDAFWPVVVLPAYMVSILALEHAVWRVKLARV